MDSAVSVHRLRIFRAVAERRSFTLAAVDLSTTQPAVSRVIQLLELATGTQLFNRQPGAVVLTEAGEQVLTYAVRVLDATLELEQSLAALNGYRHEHEREHLAIGAGPILGVYLVPALVGRFRETHPGVEISLRMGTAEELVPRLIDHQLDLLLIGNLPDSAQLESIATEKYFVDELCLVVGSGHSLAADCKALSMDALRSLPFVLPRRGSWVRGLIDAHLRHLGVRSTVVLELEETEAIKRAVQANLGAAYLSQAAIAQECASGALRVVRVDGPPLVRPVYLMHNSRRVLRTVATKFLAFCRTSRSASEQLTDR